MQHASALDPEAAGIWSELALAYLAVPDAAGARGAIAKAEAANPADLRAMEADALASAMTADWGKVNEQLNRIADRSPSLLVVFQKDWPSALEPPDGMSITGNAKVFFPCLKEAAMCTSQSYVSNHPSHSNGRVALQKLAADEEWERVAAQKAAIADPRANLQRGTALAELGKCSEAIPALERGLSAGHGSDVNGRFLLSWCYADEAGRVEASIRQAHGDDAVAHMIRGDVLLRMQANNEGAIAEYQAALIVRPQDPKLLERLAEAQLMAAHFDAAAANAQAALVVDPHRFSAMQTLARVSMEQGDYQQALPRLRELAADDPANEATQVSLANALAQTGDPADALQHLAPALERGYPDEKGSLHTLLGTLLKRVGKDGEATRAFAMARQLSEDYQKRSHQDEAK